MHVRADLWFCFLASHSPNQGASDEFVYEGYPDQESPVNRVQVEIEPYPEYAEEEEEGQQQEVIGAEDYELEETESEISDSELDQVRPNS